MRTNTIVRRLAAGATVLAVAGAGMLVSEAANADTPPPSSGGITFSPTAGIDQTVVAGTISGPCNVGESNAFQVFVTGPGPFAPNEAAGRPNGVTFRGAQTEGFSKTDPNPFVARISFKDFAQELGLPAVPVGTYTVDFRCVDELFLTVFQTYTGTITFTTPTSYTTSGAPPASPSPSPLVSPLVSPSPSPSMTTPSTTSDSATTTPTTTTSEGAGATTSSDPPAGTQPVASTGTLARTGAPIALVFLGGLILLAGGLALVVWLKRPRKVALSDGGDTAGERETGLQDSE